MGCGEVTLSPRIELAIATHAASALIPHASGFFILSAGGTHHFLLLHDFVHAHPRLCGFGEGHSTLLMHDSHTAGVVALLHAALDAAPRFIFVTASVRHC